MKNKKLSSDPFCLKQSSELSFIFSFSILTLQQDNFQNAGALAFWLANASEVLHFVQHDQDLGGISQDAQEILQECVKDTFM